MNAAPTPGRVRPRSALYLRALRAVYRLLLRLFSTRRGRVNRQQERSRKLAAESRGAVTGASVEDQLAHLARQLQDYYWHRRDA